MQGPAHEPAAKHRVDHGNAQRQGGRYAGAIANPWRSLQGLKTLAELRDHH
jgi:hypothetical protein